MSQHLVGLCWDHPRCVDPLHAAGAEWEAMTGVEISWETRSLARFGDEPLEDLRAGYDILTVDHPLIPECADAGILVALDEHLDARELERLTKEFVGPSFGSYRYAGRQWALPVDAACQVSAFRADRLPGPPPETWDEVLELIASHPGSVALALQSAQAITTLCTLCVNAGLPPSDLDRWFVSDEGRRAVELMQACADSGGSEFADAEPPAVLRALTCGDRLAYIPLVYGYVTYALPIEQGTSCDFCNIPSSGWGPVGSTLGGVGLAVSAESASIDAATAFVRWACSGSVQRGLIASAGGQPAHASAWADRAVNRATRGFYRRTLATIDAAWVRPREPWWPAFQRSGGEALQRGLVAGQPSDQILQRLAELLDDVRELDPGAAGHV
jgi:multiple sugar transport system substrate-binding protein